MKKYKLKQTIVVTVTGATVVAKIIKAGTTFFEKRNHYSYEENMIGSSVVFQKEDVESCSELFELVVEEKKEE